jgi:outer membrane receptor for Fe3+-dicitrate
LSRIAAFLILALVLASGAAGQEPPATEGDATTPDKLKIHDHIDVTDRASDLVGIADSATEGVTGQADLAKRPVLRPGEVLETVPGVMITQHSGSGKATQYYARGFSAGERRRLLLRLAPPRRAGRGGQRRPLPPRRAARGAADRRVAVLKLVASAN